MRSSDRRRIIDGRSGGEKRSCNIPIRLKRMPSINWAVRIRSSMCERKLRHLNYGVFGFFLISYSGARRNSLCSRFDRWATLIICFVVWIYRDWWNFCLPSLLLQLIGFADSMLGDWERVSRYGRRRAANNFLDPQRIYYNII